MAIFVAKTAPKYFFRKTMTDSAPIIGITTTASTTTALITTIHTAGLNTKDTSTPVSGRMPKPTIQMEPHRIPEIDSRQIIH